MINRKPVTVSGSSHGDMANSRLKETARPFRGCWLIAGPRLVAVQAVRRRRCRLYLRGWRYDPDKLRWSRDLHRSEEHTSELQSLMRISYAVFCLKKKKNTTKQNKTKHRSNKEIRRRI